MEVTSLRVGWKVEKLSECTMLDMKSKFITATSTIIKKIPFVDQCSLLE